MNLLFNVSAQNSILWLITGIIVGFLVYVIDIGNVRGAILGTILFGVSGSLIGGYITTPFFSALLGFSLIGFLAAVVGSVILSLLERVLTHSFLPQERVRYSYIGSKGGSASGTRHTKNDGHEKVNPIQVEKYLKHVDYPAYKEDLIRSALEEGADENVIHTLQAMPDRKFEGPIGVSRAIGNLQ